MSGLTRWAPISGAIWVVLMVVAFAVAGSSPDTDDPDAKIAAYMRVPRTTVMRRLDQLQNWGLINRQGRRYYMDKRALNSLLGMRSYQHIRRLIEKAAEELTVLDTLPD